MLEQLRRQSQSFIIWILFGIIIAAFVLFFGPQAGPDMFSGCGAPAGSAATVNDENVSQNSWRFAMNGLGLGSGSGEQGYANRHRAIDHLVARELLAQAAAERGFRISDKVVNDHIKNGAFYVVGYRQDGTRAYFRNGVFDYELLERLSNNLGLPSVKHFIEEQRREHMAEAMRDLLLRGATVSEEEARSTYIHENTTVTVDYVKFDASTYAGAMSLDESSIEAYARNHEEAIQDRWEADKARWQKDQAWVLARHVFLNKSSEGEETDEGDAAEEGPEKTAEERANEARERIAGGEEFAAVARELSDDQQSKFRGGSLGWRPAESLGYGKELVEAAADLEPGELSPVIETRNGYHLLQIDERHEGPLTLEQKRFDLAARLAPKYYGRLRAERDAEEALARARASSLEEIFERGARTPPPSPGGQTLQDLDPEMRRRLQEQLQRQLEQQEDAPPAPPAEPPAPAPEPEGDGEAEGGEQGAVFSEGPNVLAQGGAEPEAEEEPEPSPPAPGEEIPEAKGLEPPKLESVGPVPRSDFLAGIGRSEELVEDLFENIEVGALGDRVYEVKEPEGFVIVKLTSRTDADLEQFEEEKEQILSDLEAEKGFALFNDWLQSRCRQLAQSGEVSVNPAFLAPDDDPENQQKYTYQPCQYLSEQVLRRKLMDRLSPSLFGF